jgi:aspartate aminotransferase
MSITLSTRSERIQPSPTLVISAKAMALKRQGVDVVSLSAGEPDFDTPDFIKDAAILAIKQGFTKYTAVDGIPELKQAIVDKFKKDNNLDYTLAQVLVSCGGKQSCYNLAQAILNPGDEVIIPAPYWVSYPAFAELADARPVYIKAGIDQQFKITARQLEAAITAKTKLIYLNSPSNPTGVSYSADELRALGKVLKNHPRVVVATDDMYEKILWTPEPFANILNVCPELYDRTVILHGVSKAYSMTGWRIGYAAGPKEVIAAMEKIQSQSTSNPTSISQKAAAAALTGDQSFIGVMVKAFKERHDYLVDALNSLPGVQCSRSDGTFYSFPCVEGAMKKHGFDNDTAFCEFLLDKARVAVVPGSAFGLDGYMRLSFATSMEMLKKAIERMREVL